MRHRKSEGKIMQGRSLHNQINNMQDHLATRSRLNDHKKWLFLGKSHNYEQHICNNHIKQFLADKKIFPETGFCRRDE